MQPDIVQELEKIHEHILMELEEGTDDLSDIEIRVSELMINLQSKQIHVVDKGKVVLVLDKKDAVCLLDGCDESDLEGEVYCDARDICNAYDQLKKAAGDEDINHS